MRERGSVLILGLVVMIIILFLAGIFLQLVMVNYMHIVRNLEREKAFWIAKAGLSEAKYSVIWHWFDPDEMVKVCKEFINGKNFGSGSYRVGISPVNGPGIHEVIIVSEGMTESLEEYKAGKKVDKNTLILRLRMDVPTDYLFFWNGDAGLRLGGGGIYILGAVYANGGFFMSVPQSSPSTSGWVVNHVYFLKPDTIKGPAIHNNGTFWISYPANGDIRVGEGKIKWGPPDWTGMPTDQHYFTNNTEYNAIPYSEFQIDDNLNVTNDVYYGGWDYYAPPPVQKTPDITFPTEQYDGKKRNLLQDKYHGGYNILCPTRDTIYRVFRRYIDKNWYIRDVKDASVYGGKQIGFYNIVLKRKEPIDGTSFKNHGEETIGVTKIGENPGYTFPYRLNPTINRYYTKFLPRQWGVPKNLKIEGTSIPNDNYTVVSGCTEWWVDSFILYAPNYTPPLNAKVKANKLHFLYATNDTENYYPDAQISPVNWDIQGNSIVFKSSINEPPLDGRFGYGMVYLTASFLNPSSMSVTVINNYDYTPSPGSPGTYGIDKRHWISKWNGNSFNTGWNEVIISGNVTVDVPKTEDGRVIPWGTPLSGVSQPVRVWPAWWDRNKPSSNCQYEWHSGLMICGGSAHVEKRPLIYTGSNPDGGQAWIGWFGVPHPDFEYKTIPGYAGNHYVPKGTAYLLFFDENYNLLDSNGVIVGQWNGSTWIDPNPPNLPLTSAQIANYGVPYSGASNGRFAWEIITYNKGGGNNPYPYGKIAILSHPTLDNNPGSIGAKYVTITYDSVRREIINVSGTISHNYRAICTDTWVDAVALDLSTISEEDWPEYGVIFAEVPLYVTGIPKKKITVVSTKDIYLGSINYGYWNNDKKWVSSDLTWNDERANPVAVVSGGNVFESYFTNCDLDETPAVEVASTDYKRLNIVSNKVAIYTQADALYHVGGLFNYDRSFLHGSAIFGRAWNLTRGVNDMFHSTVIIDDDSYRIPGGRASANYGGSGGAIAGVVGATYSRRQYCESFRYNLPPAMPKTVTPVDYWEGSVEKVDSFLKDLQKTLDTLDEENEEVKKKGLTFIPDDEWEELVKKILE